MKGQLQHKNMRPLHELCFWLCSFILGHEVCIRPYLDSRPCRFLLKLNLPNVLCCFLNVRVFSVTLLHQNELVKHFEGARSSHCGQNVSIFCAFFFFFGLCFLISWADFHSLFLFAWKSFYSYACHQLRILYVVFI